MIHGGTIKPGLSSPVLTDRGVVINLDDEVTGKEIADEYESLRDLVLTTEQKYDRSIADKILLRKGKGYYPVPELNVKGAFHTGGLADAPPEIRDEDQRIWDVSVDNDPETADTLTVLIKDGMTDPAEYGDVFVTNEVVRVKYTEHDGYIIREAINAIDSDATFHHRRYDTPIDYVYGKKGDVIKVDENNGKIMEKREMPDGQIPEAGDFFDSFLELAAQPGSALD